jgi:D-alanyl-D-alanine carboxypeptidase/D-alanyl-D-alanine-endopeptidase (penicillin-binding protein 4)
MIGRWVVCAVLMVGAAARADLKEEIKGILRDKYLSKVQMGIAVVRLGEDAAHDEGIYRFESDIPRIPASNLKLLTTSAFLDHFGSDFKFRTVLLMNREGDVVIVGDGDPTLGDVELLKKVGWGATTTFEQWASALKKRGVNSVRNVVVDDSVFDEVFIHPNWSPRYAHSRYSAQVGGINLNANCVDFWLTPSARGELVKYALVPDTRYVNVRNACVSGGGDNVVGLTRPAGSNDLTLRGEIRSAPGEAISVTIHDPPMFAGTVFSETLAREGVNVTGSVVRDREARARYAGDQNGWTVVAALETKVGSVLDRANKDSMNLYAESMCKRLGNAVSGQSGSWANGTAAVGEFLKRIGLNDAEFHLDDGCGLSRENSVSADALAKVLAYNFHGKNWEIFRSSLAVPGEEGTFKTRFKGELSKRVWGKSGYVDGVSAVSGYLKGRDEKWYAFSILMNNVPGGTNSDAKKVQERIVGAVDQNSD